MKAAIDAKLENVMKIVYAAALSLLGFAAIIFNRFAAEETQRIMRSWPWPKFPVWFGRIVVILSGIFFVLFGVIVGNGLPAVSFIWTKDRFPFSLCFLRALCVSVVK